MKALFQPLLEGRRIRAIEDLERRMKKKLGAFDWLVLMGAAALLTLGALAMFVEASRAIATEVPAPGGTHTEGVVGAPRFINPLLATSETDRDLTELLFSGLLKAAPDGTLSPLLAETFSVSEDGLTYRFTLRDHAVFHDGTPVTADDVVFTVEAAQNPDIKSPRRPNWEGVTVIAEDERTVVFTLKSPYALFLENATLGILPSHVWKMVKPEEFPFTALNTRPVGSGPYALARVVENDTGVPTEYRLRAFSEAVRPPLIRTIVFSIFQNQEELAAAFAEGKIDAAHSLLPSEGDTVHRAVFGRVFGVFFNQNQQRIFTEAAVRQSLDAAIDKDRLVATLLSGYGTPLSGPLPPTEVVTVHSVQDSDHTARAQAILESAGWERGEDGVYAKETKEGELRLAFSLTTGNAPELRRAAEAVAEAWREVGAEVSVQFFDQNDLTVTVIRPRKYDALLFGLVVGRELDLFAFWHASQRNDPGLNIGLYASITADTLLEEAREERDPRERREKAEAAAREISNDTAAVFLYAPHFLYSTQPELRGITLGTIAAPSDRFLTVEEWYLKTERLWPLFQ